MRPSRLYLGLCAAALSVGLIVTGCDGLIGGAGGSARKGGNCDRPSCDVAEAAAPSSAAPRLTHTQWTNTVTDLLRLDTRPTQGDSFTNDSQIGLFNTNSSNYRVSSDLWLDYQNAAEELAEEVSSDAAKLARVTPNGLPSDLAARGRGFIEAFGRRAFRRPLTNAEVDAHGQLFDDGPQHFDSMDPFAAGARIVMEAMLQSPHFVYRVERSDDVKKGLIELDGFEIATRLSYALFNTMPDDALLDAAAGGDLDTDSGLQAQVRAMLADPRAADTVEAFHSQLLEWDTYAEITRDTATFPNFKPGMGQDMIEEARRLVDHVVFERNLGLKELLTADYTFVNGDLAAVYGASGSMGDEFQQLNFDTPELNGRAGFLTQLGFLSTRSGPTGLIHRGVFVNERILCTEYNAARPTEFPPPPPELDATMRVRIDQLTGKGTCGEACHFGYINPAGAAFDHFDSLGQYRTEQFGHAIDAASAFDFYAGAQPFYGAAEFAQAAAGNFEAHDCYTKHLLEFTFGRSASPEDSGLIQRLGDASLEGMGTLDLLVELLSSDAFRTRIPGEA